ncbi:hypothetical protein RCL1_006898 [Eukaryota sp. TZLM3-RCL]
MSSIGTGYDLSPTTYSPDGRVFQVEYALKAVSNSGTVVALRVKDGVVLAVEKEVPSKLLVMSSQRRIYTIDGRIGIAMAGLTADARTLAAEARSQASEWRTNFGIPITPSQLAHRLALHIHTYTMRSPVRPYGVSVLLAGMEDGKPKLFHIDPSGTALGYMGTSIGGRSHQAKSEIEKLSLDELSVFDGVKECGKILHVVRQREQAQTKEFCFEMTWVSEQRSHELVPDELVVEADRLGQQFVDEMEM